MTLTTVRTATADVPSPAASPNPTRSRRDVLRTAGIVALSGGAVLTLAACGAEGQAGDPVPTSAAPTSAPSSSAASPSASSSPSASASPSRSAAKAPSGPSVATADVPVGGGVILDDADYVVTQPSKGTYKAFSKICTHQGCKVGSVADGVIKCPCHGSQFSIEDGSVKRPPANKPLPESETTVAGSKVYVTG
jgi:Rieske Fe-S protein